MNDIASTTDLIVPDTEDEGSEYRGVASLSPMQRAFAIQFVTTGGKGRRAAILAGYSAKSAHVSAAKNLCNKRVLTEIDRLCRLNIRAALPVAIKTLIDVCMNSTDPKARVMAANSILDRSGIAAPRGGVQVNVGVQVNGGAAQRLIAEVWNARAERMSDIPTAMPDNLQALSDAIDALEEDGDDGEGGGRIQGPAAGSPSIPPPSTATSSNSESGLPPAAIEAWREVTGDGADGDG